MKRIFVYMLLLLFAAKVMPFSATDAAKMHPVEVIRLRSCAQGFLVETDTGCSGVGSETERAFQDLQRKATGKVFLDTAEYLLVDIHSLRALTDIAPLLRPSCKVCLEQGKSELKEVAAYLETHRPEVTLMDYQAGELALPVLIVAEGGMRLEQ